MPTIIDALLITLGYDTKGLEEGEKKQKQSQERVRKHVETENKKVQESTKKAAEGFNELKRGAEQFLGLFVGGAGIAGFVSFLNDVKKLNQELGFASRIVGVSANNLMAYGGMSKAFGGSPEAAANSMMALKSYQYNYQVMGQNPLVNEMAALGIDISDFNDLPSLYKKLNRRAAQMQAAGPNGANNFLNTVRKFGLDPGTIQALMQTPAEYDKQLAEQKKQADLATRNAKATEAFDKAMAALNTQLTSLATNLLEKILPPLTRFVEYLNEHPKVTEGLVKGVLVFLAALTAISAIAIPASILSFMGSLVALAGGAVAAGGEGLLIAAAPAIGAAIGKALADFLVAQGIIKPDTPPAGTPPWKGDPNPFTRPGHDPNPFSPKTGVGWLTQGEGTDYFMALGLSRAQASGLTAALMAESGGGNPNAENPRSHARGLAQWLTKGRLADFKDFTGTDVAHSTKAQQLAFVWHELTHKEQAALRAILDSNTSEEALRAAIGKYERPGLAGFGVDWLAGMAFMGGSQPGGRVSHRTVHVHGGVHVHTPTHDPVDHGRRAGAAMVDAVNTALV